MLEALTWLRGNAAVAFLLLLVFFLRYCTKVEQTLLISRSFIVSLGLAYNKISTRQSVLFLDNNWSNDCTTSCCVNSTFLYNIAIGRFCNRNLGKWSFGHANSEIVDR